MTKVQRIEQYSTEGFPIVHFDELIFTFSEKNRPIIHYVLACKFVVLTSEWFVLGAVVMFFFFVWEKIFCQSLRYSPLISFKTAKKVKFLEFL